ncbi:MAG: branched-chain amino acid ABC transporter permease [Candidatus Bathyarchaeia archaeon]|nr:branched-chain amino acid ABC transporter permease [Candidatus Bathyarchaeota archaeon]
MFRRIGEKIIKSINVTSTLMILAIPLLIFAPYFLTDYYLSVLRTVLLWLALTISWHFFSGLTKYVSLGSAGFFGLGAYFTAKYLEMSYRGYLPHIPIPLVILIGGLINFVLASVIGLVTLRVKSIYFAILTFGISEMLRNFFQWWEIRITGTRGTYLPIIFEPSAIYYSILASALVAIILTTILRKSKFGLALRMIGECEEAAVHIGVNAILFKTLSFGISAMCIGFVGGCFTTRAAYINTDIAFDPLFSFLPAVMTLLGGGQIIYGPVTGSILLSLLEEYLRAMYPHYFLTILGFLFIIIIMFMPNGLIGEIEKIRSKIKK